MDPYRSYLQPAVMIACDKGFVVLKDNLGAHPNLSNFLNQKTPTFSCGSLPHGDAPFTPTTGFRAWFYMQYTVGLVWKFFGLSYENVDKLIAIMFSISILAVYGIFRLGMGRAISLVASAVFATCNVHLKWSVILRDYSKAPFILVSIFILGYLVTKKLSYAKQLLLVIALGIIVGVGYGFRPDLLIIVPFALLAIFFIPPKISYRNIFKSCGLAICLLLTTYLTLTPVLKTFDDKTNIGTCQWHFVLLGLGNGFNQGMRVQPSIYDMSYQFNDSFMSEIVESYANREFKIKDIGFCTRQYDKASSSLYIKYFKTFPSDYVTRVFASVKSIVSVLPKGKDYYKFPGLIFCSLAFVILLFSGFRYGLFYLLFVLYFFGYPSLVFSERHAFHLYFFPLWNIGFIIQFLLSLSDHSKRERVLSSIQKNYLRVCLFLPILVVLLTTVLWITRWYQSQTVKQLIQSYISAPKENINSNKKYLNDEVIYTVKISKDPNYETYSTMLNIGLKDTPNCQSKSYNIKIKYDIGKYSYLNDYAKELVVNDMNLNRYNTNLFIPIYFDAIREPIMHVSNSFKLDIILPKSEEFCIKNISRIKTYNFYPIWTPLEIPTNWERIPLYLRLR